jgi:hypothetical protein
MGVVFAKKQSKKVENHRRIVTPNPGCRVMDSTILLRAVPDLPSERAAPAKMRQILGSKGLSPLRPPADFDMMKPLVNSRAGEGA